ncbi:hypothetical protein WR25_26892 [Diploscapter pachys]|uniref:Arrestin C-terminal-like domain-containing protein n=1 Tax=Diploscapter pachys TaxID=2018661 RepID=A0A2A2J787_9BILA|nr:hypothetical protein WR25_26892 [Diploscapter pachys]
MPFFSLSTPVDKRLTDSCFCIELTNSPLGVYRPGQTVEGVLRLNIEGEITAPFIRLVFDGHASTHWSESESKTDSLGRDCTETTNYDAKTLYVYEYKTLWSSTDTNPFLPQGKNEYSFTFHLPPNCAPSFGDSSTFLTCGHIQYAIYVEVSNSRYRVNRKFGQKIFSVIPTVNLAMIPNTRLPLTVTRYEDEQYAICKRYKKDIHLTCRIPKRGYVPGETIDVETQVENNSGKQITYAKVKLKQFSQYIAYRISRQNAPTFQNREGTLTQ